MESGRCGPRSPKRVGGPRRSSGGLPELARALAERQCFHPPVLSVGGRRIQGARALRRETPFASIFRGPASLVCSLDIAVFLRARWPSPSDLVQLAEALYHAVVV
ncbi:hypothetical protein MRX96_013087 [Rhipicephalus microplus]